ncbi:hypothetical protein IB211_02565c [Intestinimonas butyriciproducens]|uniref:Uncharacterized protein n=1 Tax=Intestinimonas butyriciproducens TaxID=1297617 RepID=A0A0S2W6J6_9FIRM|nr:hypothetical protein IB211_02565c [Intestinimonas butyriciproducens]
MAAGSKKESGGPGRTAAFICPQGWPEEQRAVCDSGRAAAART